MCGCTYTIPTVHCTLLYPYNTSSICMMCTISLHFLLHHNVPPSPLFLPSPPLPFCPVATRILCLYITFPNTPLPFTLLVNQLHPQPQPDPRHHSHPNLPHQPHSTLHANALESLIMAPKVAIVFVSSHYASLEFNQFFTPG